MTEEQTLPTLTSRAVARGATVITVAAVLTFAVTVLGVAIGARDISVSQVIEILLHPGAEDYDSLVLWDERIPRTLLGLLVGAALGGSGLLMQGLTLNPLADPGILGVETGAAFAVVIGIVVFDVTSLGGYFWLALLGAAVTSVLVYLVGVRSSAGGSAVGLILAGAATSALFASAITLFVVHSPSAAASLRGWSVGQLTGRGHLLDNAWPFLVVGLLTALPLGRTLNALALGEDTAAGLGVRVHRAQLLVAGSAVLLCAAATAACGPVAFVGLICGHVGRMVAGTDHRWSLPLAMLAGATLLLVADVAGRMIPGAGELSVGITTALVGAPFFVWLARRRSLVTI